MINKNSLLFTLLFLTVTVAHAQDLVRIDTLTNWKKALKSSFGLNQAATSDNWNSGVIKLFGINAAFNYQANYTKDRHSWFNEFDLLYGTLNANGLGFRKSADRIFIDSKYGYKINDKWKITGGINILTQFGSGYKYEADPNNSGSFLKYATSGFLAPMYISIPIGVDYTPTNYFSLNLSPITPRATIVRVPSRYNNDGFDGDKEKPFGVRTDKGKNYIVQAGFQVLAKFDKDIVPNINLKWQYLGFMDWADIRYQKINHRLDLTITARVYKYITVGFTGIFIYNAQQSKNVQWSQLFSIGYQYSYKNHK